ncbi:hypothetical protein MM326_15020 [Alkalihalobacillus sp. LMS6]|uniref:hypothetical protein n=1 Tax=Alkalihalobacillus sp. LMS6 TaxID=2924034 RepID=UPI0020D0D6CC|nr:hypothetical protein [Alkalihalobacillus sp. LMS6]UTR05408.1 hypothetical protein MM326_15020 [Alkalihalobacillus sp. LMS6]
MDNKMIIEVLKQKNKRYEEACTKMLKKVYEYDEDLHAELEDIYDDCMIKWERK